MRKKVTLEFDAQRGLSVEYRASICIADGKEVEVPDTHSVDNIGWLDEFLTFPKIAKGLAN